MWNNSPCVLYYFGMIMLLYCEAYPTKYPNALLLIFPSTLVGDEKGFPIAW